MVQQPPTSTPQGQFTLEDSTSFVLNQGFSFTIDFQGVNKPLHNIGVSYTHLLHTTRECSSLTLNQYNSRDKGRKITTQYSHSLKITKVKAQEMSE